MRPITAAKGSNVKLIIVEGAASFAELLHQKSLNTLCLSDACICEEATQELIEYNIGELVAPS